MVAFQEGPCRELCYLSPFAWLSLVVDHTASFAAEGAGCLFSERGTHTLSLFHAIWRLPINQPEAGEEVIARVAKRPAGFEGRRSGTTTGDRVVPPFHPSFSGQRADSGWPPGLTPLRAG